MMNKFDKIPSNSNWLTTYKFLRSKISTVLSNDPDARYNESDENARLATPSI